MSEVETVFLPHLPEFPLYVTLHKHVKNASFLRQQLLDGNTAFEYAFLDASVVLSRLHLLAACFRAINDMNHNRLKSRNVHSEIVFAFSSTNNIAESFRRFGLTDTTKHVISVKVGTKPDITAQSVALHLQQNVQGTSTDLTDDALLELADLARLRKIYKLNAQQKGNKTSGLQSRSLEQKELETSIVALMALKGS